MGRNEEYSVFQSFLQIPHLSVFRGMRNARRFGAFNRRHRHHIPDGGELLFRQTDNQNQRLLHIRKMLRAARHHRRRRRATRQRKIRLFQRSL